MLLIKAIFTMLTVAMLSIPSNINLQTMNTPTPIIGNNVQIGAFTPPSPYDGGLTALISSHGRQHPLQHITKYTETGTSLLNHPQH